MVVKPKIFNRYRHGGIDNIVIIPPLYSDVVIKDRYNK